MKQRHKHSPIITEAIELEELQGTLEANEPKSKKFSLKLLLNISVSLLTMVLLFKFADIDFKSVLRQIKETQIEWFVLSCLMILATVFTNTYRWYLLTKLLNYRISFSHALKMYFESSFSNNFLPTNFGGDALRAYDLGKAHKDWLRAASTVITERLLGFIVMFALLPIGLWYLSQSSISGQIPSKIILVLWLSFAFTVFSILSYGLWSRIPWIPVAKIRYAVEEYTKCHRSIIKVIILTLVTHACLYAGNMFAAKSIGINLSYIPLWYWVLTIPAATLISFVVPAVKGIGAKEASYVYFLGLIGISSDKSLAIAFIVFIATMISSLPGLTLAFRKVK